jgi:hypothetical protein
MVSELETAMAAHMNRMAEIRKTGTEHDTYIILEKVMSQTDEVSLKQFLAKRSANEFDECGYGFVKCAQKYGLPFVEYIEKLAEEKGWTTYLIDVISEARLEVE